MGTAVHKRRRKHAGPNKDNTNAPSIIVEHYKVDFDKLCADGYWNRDFTITVPIRCQAKLWGRSHVEAGNAVRKMYPGCKITRITYI